MAYKNQTSIVIPKETKEKLRKQKEENETWEELLVRIAKLDII